MSSQPEARVAVITGASSGIGKASAVALAQLGWRIIGVGRDAARCAEAEREIAAALGPGAKVEFLRADFDSMAEVRRVAGEIAALTDRIDVLVNNAGGVRDARYETVDGLEATFAANHLAPFLLTRELLPILRVTASRAILGAVRIIAVSSEGHEYCPAIKWHDLQFTEGFTTGAAYCQAKLANILFTRELARRLAGENIAPQAMHPGKVASNFAAHAEAQMQHHFATLDCLPPSAPARTIAWLASDTEGGRLPGRFFHDCGELAPAPQALDAVAARRLWDESEAILARLGI